MIPFLVVGAELDVPVNFLEIFVPAVQLLYKEDTSDVNPESEYREQSKDAELFIVKV